MEKDLRNIPDWKIPPAEEVCRRGSGQFTQRIVGNRRSSRILQSHEALGLSRSLDSNDKPTQETLGDGFDPLPSPRHVQSSSESNSQKSESDAEIEESDQPLPYRDKINAESISKRSRKKAKNGDKSSVARILTNSGKRVDRTEEITIDNSEYTHGESSDKQEELLRKGSFPKRIKQHSFQLRPRSKSLHLDPNVHQQSNYSGDHLLRPYQEHFQERYQASTCSRPDSRSLNKSILEVTSPFKDTGGPERAAVTKSLASGSEPRRNPSQNKEKSLPSLAREGGREYNQRLPCGGEAGGNTILCQDLEQSGSSEYDTDCEPGDFSALRGPDSLAKKMKEDVDIGHLTYENACAKFQVKPRRRVRSQLWEQTLSLPHAGLLTAEIRALGPALKVNSRIENVDLSGNFLTPEALTVISKAVIDNVNVVKLNLSMSTFNPEAASAFSDMLSSNHWLVSLDISNSSIGDNEIENLVRGIQNNCRLECLNLRKNSVGVLGALQLGRALAESESLKCVDLSWNHIRGGGAVAVCHCLIKNTVMEDLDLSWNGIGFEGSLALGSALKQNSTLKRLNLTNNRINWDCAPHLSPALAMNSSLECLEIGQNPISMEGCEEILTGVAKPRCNLKFLSLSGIPINTKIVMLATEIAKMRPFTLDHGGILNTRDVIGIQRARREDPLSLLIRYLSAMGIRVMDLFRMMDKDNSLHVSRQKFIQGLKRVRVPLDEDDIMLVARRLQSNKHGFISYQELAANVRNRIREDRLEDKRQEILLKKKKEERRRILQSDRPMNAPSYLPTLYHMYEASEHGMSATPGGSRVMSRASDRLFSPSGIGSFSGRGSAFSLLPRITSGGFRYKKIGGHGGKTSASASGSPVMNFVGQNALLNLTAHASSYSPAVSQRSSAKGDRSIRATRGQSVSSTCIGNDFLGAASAQSQGENSRLPNIGKAKWRQSAQDLLALRARKLV